MISRPESPRTLVPTRLPFARRPLRTRADRSPASRVRRAATPQQATVLDWSARLSARLLVALGAAAAVMLTASPASAHVEPDITSAPAGSRTTLEFNIEHGCDGSPTVEMAMQLPPGITDVVPVDEPGWQVASADGTIRWTGGALPADVEGSFGVTFTVPQVAGQKLYFPTVQRCQVGELAWIDTESAESENPAPILEVTDAIPGTTPPTTTPPPTTAPTTTTTVATTSTQPDTTAPEASDDTSDDEDGSSPVPVAVGGAAVVAVAAGGWVAFKRRQV